MSIYSSLVSVILMSKKIAIVHSGTIDQLLCAFILGFTAVSMD
jgi:hypothetical protein